jgi:hypothetical protein
METNSNDNQLNTQNSADTNQATPVPVAASSLAVPPTKPKAESGSLAAPSPQTAPPYSQNTADAIVLTDKVCYESEDGQFRIEQLVKKVAKYPPSPYPCVVMKFFPENHTRIRKTEDGGLEAMLSNFEIEQFISAFNSAAMASGKGRIFEVLQRVPEKTKQHKQKWKRFNEARLGIRPNWQPKNNRGN